METSQPTLIPVETFFRPPELVSVQISPDGSRLAWLAPYHNRLNVAVRAISGDAEPRFITQVKDRDLSGFFWKDSELLYLRDFGGDENYHLFRAVEGGDDIDLTPFEDCKAEIIDTLPDEENYILVALNKEQPDLFDAYKLNIVSGALELILKNPGGAMRYRADRRGVIRSFSRTDGATTETFYRATAAEDFRLIKTTAHDTSFSLAFYPDDEGDIVYAMSNCGRDKVALVRYSVEKDTEEVVYIREEVDLDDIMVSRKRHRILGVSYIVDYPEKHYFDQEAAAISAHIAELLGTSFFDITSTNREETMSVVAVSTDTTFAEYHLFDKAARSLTFIGSSKPFLPKEHMAEMKAIRYEARDGLTIQAYLTLPKGIEPKNLPLVLVPHGGPWVRDEWGFSPDIQFLANRGYAVLQPNYRGSTGFGKSFFTASFKEWGGKMQDDLTDAVRWAIEQGIANPDKVAIYGGSYGGYATLAGLTFTPELYACGIDVVGVSNLFTFLETIPPYWKPLLEQTYKMVGHPVEDKELLMARSPVFHADKIQVPLLIFQGAKDPRVKISESDQVVEALKNHNIPFEYIVKENEGHGFRNLENRIEMYQRVESFLAEHLGSDLS